MKRVNHNDVAWVERSSPNGKYRKSRRNLARALATSGDGPNLPAGAPFEVELMRIPAGSSPFPYHSHSAEWECYLILSGRGSMRGPAGSEPLALSPGDCVMCPPGDAHQIVNDGDADLIYYVIANNGDSDIWHYPDSGKWGFHLPGAESVFFRMTEADYYDAEE